MEVEKVMKNQKKKFTPAIDKLQECFTNLEQYDDRLCVRVEDIPVPTDEIAGKVFEKVENILKETCPIGCNYKCFKTNNTCVTSLYVSTVSSIEHCSIGTGIN